MMLHGLQVIVVPPIKTFSLLLMPSRSKVGSRQCKVRRHTGFAEAMPDGQVFKDENKGLLLMNQTTKRELDKWFQRNIV